MGLTGSFMVLHLCIGLEKSSIRILPSLDCNFLLNGAMLRPASSADADAVAVVSAITTTTGAATTTHDTSIRNSFIVVVFARCFRL